MEMKAVLSDRIIAVAGVVGTLLFCMLIAYEYGRDEATQQCREEARPKVVRCDPLTTDKEECYRICRARVRMEKVK